MLRQLRPAAMSVLVLMVFTGLLFPGVIAAIAQAAFPHRANGSLITRRGRVIGSELIGQTFVGAAYFHPRPSAAGSGYDASNSGATNLGPTSAKLIGGIKNLAAAYRAENGLAEDAPVPADAATRSASGLDPHISPANAALQIGRVAKARGLPEDVVRDLLTKRTEGRHLGIFGEPRVNVLLLNLDLDARSGTSGDADR